MKINTVVNNLNNNTNEHSMVIFFFFLVIILNQKKATQKQITIVLKPSLFAQFIQIECYVLKLIVINIKNRE